VPERIPELEANRLRINAISRIELEYLKVPKQWM
jgi:hypothetical protein